MIGQCGMPWSLGSVSGLVSASFARRWAGMVLAHPCPSKVSKECARPWSWRVACSLVVAVFASVSPSGVFVLGAGRGVAGVVGAVGRSLWFVRGFFGCCSVASSPAAM